MDLVLVVRSFGGAWEKGKLDELSEERQSQQVDKITEMESLSAQVTLRANNNENQLIRQETEILADKAELQQLRLQVELQQRNRRNNRRVHEESRNPKPACVQLQITEERHS